MKLSVLVLFSLLVFLADTSEAYTVDELQQEFDARDLSADEKRLLQTGLAFSRHYNGMLDGKWGSGSQRALERYSADFQQTDRVPNWVAVLVADAAVSQIRQNHWQHEYIAALNMSVLLPDGDLNIAPTKTPGDSIVFADHAKSSLRYGFVNGPFFEMEHLHRLATERAVAGTTPYTVRQTDRWITSLRQDGNRSIYIRSDAQAGTWSTVTLSATDKDGGILAAVSGSLRKGREFALFLPAYGKLAAGQSTLQKILDDADRVPPQALPPRPASPAPSQSPSTGTRQSSGTGFLVSDKGHMLTNAHVVRACARISITGAPAYVIGLDESADLALLQSQALSGMEPARFSAGPALLNSDVTVVGYPLAGLLTGLNVTRGAVTSLKGLRGDAFTMQISAPVQPGNSGGPVLNAAGAVVGVVVSKLDARHVAELTGDIPQNVNFAIRGEIAKLFMAQNGVSPLTSAQEQRMEPETLAQMASAFTRQILCH